MGGPGAGLEGGTRLPAYPPSCLSFIHPSPQSSDSRRAGGPRTERGRQPDPRPTLGCWCLERGRQAQAGRGRLDVLRDPGAALNLPRPLQLSKPSAASLDALLPGTCPVPNRTQVLARRTGSPRPCARRGPDGHPRVGRVGVQASFHRAPPARGRGRGRGRGGAVGGAGGGARPGAWPGPTRRPEPQRRGGSAAGDGLPRPEVARARPPAARRPRRPRSLGLRGLPRSEFSRGPRSPPHHAAEKVSECADALWARGTERRRRVSEPVLRRDRSPGDAAEASGGAAVTCGRAGGRADGLGQHREGGAETLVARGCAEAGSPPREEKGAAGRRQDGATHAHCPPHSLARPPAKQKRCPALCQGHSYPPQGWCPAFGDSPPTPPLRPQHAGDFPSCTSEGNLGRVGLPASRSWSCAS